MEIRKEINELLIDLKRIRRKLHMIPEIGFNTKNTMKLIKQLVSINPIEDDGISGVFYFKSSEKCIAFRCELDGLNIVEENNIEYRSLNNYMHACGHDLHMAIMILMINYYSNYPHKPSLLFIFQPAEESGAGANYMIEKGLIEKYNVKELYAFHVLPNLGDFIGCSNGIIMSQSCEIEINFKGLSGHITSNNSIDSIKTTNYFLNEFYKLKNEIKPHKIHIGSIQGGTVCNSVAESCTLKGTIRCLEENMMDFIKECIENLLYRIDSKFKTKSTIKYSIGYPPLINNIELVSKIKRLAEDSYIAMEPLLLSEDFSYYGNYCNICYMFCGLTTSNELHSSTFDLKEEDCLKMLELYFRIIENS